MKDEIKEKDIIQKSIKCLANAKLETTYEVARDIVLDYITNLQEEKTRIRKILIEHIEEARYELNVILHSNNDLNYKNECSKEFEILNKNIRMILNKIDNGLLQGSDKDE